MSKSKKMEITSYAPTNRGALLACWCVFFHTNSGQSRVIRVMFVGKTLSPLTLTPFWIHFSHFPGKTPGFRLFKRLFYQHTVGNVRGTTPKYFRRVSRNPVTVLCRERALRLGSQGSRRGQGRGWARRWSQWELWRWAACQSWFHLESITGQSLGVRHVHIASSLGGSCSATDSSAEKR